MGRKAARIIALLLGTFASQVLAGVVWHDDLETARKRAAATSRMLLVFFSDATAPLSAHNLRLCEDKRVQQELLEAFELVRLDFGANRELAQALHVFKAGSIFVYSSDGKPVLQVQRIISAEEFALQLYEAKSGRARRAAAGPAPVVPASPTAAMPAVAAHKAPVTTASSATAPPPPPNGRIVAGPLTAPLKSNRPLELGTLQQGKSYVLRVEGTGSIWGGYQNTLDAIYSFANPYYKGPMKRTSIVRIGDGRAGFTDFLRDSKKLPPYHLSHTYNIPLEGNGQPFRLVLLEKSDYAQSDNSGAFVFTLYEAGGSSR